MRSKTSLLESYGWTARRGQAFWATSRRSSSPSSILQRMGPLFSALQIFIKAVSCSSSISCLVPMAFGRNAKQVDLLVKLVHHHYTGPLCMNIVANIMKNSPHPPQFRAFCMYQALALWRCSDGGSLLPKARDQRRYSSTLLATCSLSEIRKPN